MPQNKLIRSILLPKLKLLRVDSKTRFYKIYEVEKKREFGICNKCANVSNSIYDHRFVTVKDAPLRDCTIILKIKKRRFYCKPCNRVFTEYIDGIMPRRKTTQRFRASLFWACRTFSDLKKVKKVYRCSNDLIYRALYEQLELRRRTRLYPWPSTIGIDEHAFKRSGRYRKREFVTMIVDYNNNRLKEVVLGKTSAELKDSLSYIEGRESVSNAIIDMSDPYKKFIKEFFPNAEIIADKFHVLRLIHPAINRFRREITGDKRSHPVRKLLLRSRRNLQYYERSALDKWLRDHYELNQLYKTKEALHNFYRIRGYNKAKRILQKLFDTMALSPLKEIQKLRKTLMRWRHEILAYFKKKLTNGKTEGYNNKAKVVKRRSYGFRNFNNYRLRLLSACS